MARVQLGLNVSDLSAAVDFYTRLLGVGPRKLEPGYANFAVEDPPLKLVLFEGSRGGTINHLGVEVDEPGEVDGAQRRLTEAGLTLVEERGTDCCYAVQDKVWARDPDGVSWEYYTVLADSSARRGS